MNIPMMVSLAARRRRRRRAVLVTLACGIATILGCLGVNVLMGSPVEWFWLVVAPLYVTLLVGGFLLIRLAPEA